MIVKTEQLNSQEFDNFVKNHPNGHLLQLSAWADVKELNGWYSKRIAVYNDENNIIATCIILFRKVGLANYTLAYIPKGFVADFTNREITKIMLAEIVRVAKENKAIVVDCEPYLLRGAENYLEQYGFKHQGYEAEKFIYQTQFDMITPLAEDKDSAETFDKKTKKFLKTAEKSGLIFEKAPVEKIDIFSKLSDITSKRNGISLRQENYYKQIVELFSRTNDCDYYLVKLDKDLFREQTEKKLKNLTKEIKNIEKKERTEQIEKELLLRKNKLESLTKDLEKITEDDIYLSGCLVLYCGQTAYYLYAASSDDFRYLQPNIFMNYHAMEEAKKRGCTAYNLGGYKSITDGLYPFKLSLGGESKEFEGIFSYVINKPLYLTMKLALHARKYLQKLKNK